MARLLLSLLVLAAPAQETAWRDAVEQGGVRVTLRKAPLFSRTVLDAARGGKPLREAVRIAFSKPGWFLNSAVEAAAYTLDVEGAGPDLQMSLRDGKGALLGFEGFWIDPPTETEPVAELSLSDGAVLVTIKCDEIRLPYRFVSGESHGAAARGFEARVGRVVVVSDLGQPEIAAALAKEADRAIDVHAELLGRQAPKGPFRLHLFGSEKTYQGVDKLVTGGRFQRNGAVASPLTMQAYVWHVGRHDADASRDHGATLKARSLVVHELGHLVAYASRPGSTAWPSWISEGLAEEGTRRALGKDGESFHGQQAALWRLAERTGNVPVLEDLLFRYAGTDLPGWYSSAYLFARRLAADEKPLHELLGKLDSERLRSRSGLVAREALEDRAGAWWRGLREEAAKGEVTPVPVFGYLDPTPDGWRLATPSDSQGRVLLPDEACRAECALEGAFSWQPVGIRQADFYLAYAAGREGAQFLKVAIVPKQALLFRYFDDRWEEWGRRDFDAALKEGDGKSRAWHAVKVGLRAKEKKLSVSVDGGKGMDFELRTFVPTEGTWAGFGAYDSIVYFKDVRVR